MLLFKPAFGGTKAMKHEDINHEFIDEFFHRLTKQKTDPHSQGILT